MKLKGLEMQGFKSFPDKTHINFDSGITAVIGPNGSGKSNISDAVRWVLGEMSLKSLRGSRMEDVVFSGSDKRTAANSASVSLILEKDDSGEETVVTRKYYRSGESEYYLDKKQVRLKDIYEAFYNTGIGREGYSVIGQGKISEVLSQKSEERRSIFEEAAGISKYRYQKAEAERKLAATEANLQRVSDIMGEIGGRLAPLEKEAENAKKYLLLSEEKKGLEISLWLNKIDSVRAELSKSEEIEAGASQALATANERIKQLEAGTDAVYLQGSEISRDISAAEKSVSDIGLKISEADGKKALKHNDIAHFEKLVEDCLKEIENSAAEKGRLDTAILEADSACSVAEQELEISKLAYAEKLNMHSAVRDDYTKKSIERNDIQSAYTSVLESRTSVATEYAAIKANLENAKRNAESSADEISGFEGRISEMEEKLKALRSELEAATIALKQAESEANTAAEAVHTAEKRIETFKADNAALSLEITSLKQRKENLTRMEQLLEGYSDSVKNVIGAAKAGKIVARERRAVLHGTVSSVLSADEKYVVALETALGAAVQHIIVDNEEDAKACIRYLKETGGGRASFLPITTVRGPRADDAELKKCEGFVGIGCDLCKYDAQYKNIFTKLLGETVVCTDIDSAAVIAKKCGYRLRIVTLDGQIIHQGGSFTGGSAAKRVGILTRSIDIERLSAAIAEKEKLLKKGEALYNTENARLAMFTAESDQAHMKLAVAKSKTDSVSNSIGFEQMRLAEEKRRYRQFTDNSGGITKQLALLSATATACAEKLKNAEEEARILSERLAQAVRAAELADKASAASYEELNKARFEVADKETALNRIKEKQAMLTERRRNMDVRVRECELSAENSRKQIELLRQEIAEIERLQADLAAEKEKHVQSINALLAGKADNEKEAMRLREELKQAQAEKEEAFKYHTSVETRKGVLTGEYDEYSSKLWEEYELTYSSALQFRLPPESMDKAPSRLNTLKSRIRAMGNINVNAVEEYRETKERYDFLSEQTEDLNKTRKSLDNAIEKLETNMKQAFIQTFEQINAAFGEVFCELFGGGTAKCLLEDEANPLTSGIEIIIRPPGKSVKNINLLSGGEQSFAAVALYLALQRINPAPFCIFDEIESALDEVNVNRLGEYLKHHSEATQFIMITHRRGTMECADVIYGITMKEKGVSDYIKLDIRALEQNSDYK